MKESAAVVLLPSETNTESKPLVPGNSMNKSVTNLWNINKPTEESAASTSVDPGTTTPVPPLASEEHANDDKTEEQLKTSKKRSKSSLQGNVAKKARCKLHQCI